MKDLIGNSMAANLYGHYTASSVFFKRSTRNFLQLTSKKSLLKPERNQCEKYLSINITHIAMIMERFSIRILCYYTYIQITFCGFQTTEGYESFVPMCQYLKEELVCLLFMKICTEIAHNLTNLYLNLSLKFMTCNFTSCFKESFGAATKMRKQHM